MGMNYGLIQGPKARVFLRSGFSVSNVLFKGLNLPRKGWGMYLILGGKLDLVLTRRLGLQAGYYTHRPIRHQPGCRSLRQPLLGLVYYFNKKKGEVSVKY